MNGGSMRSRVKRSNPIKKMLIGMVIIIGAYYYGYVGIKCVAHYKELIDGRVSTINLM
jgi:hypothetical protein